MKYKNKCVVKAQKIVRGYLARKQHRPRFKGIIKIKALRSNVQQMESIANQLKSERESMLKQLKEIDTQIDMAIKKIKVR
jgi:myosin-6